MKPIALYYLSLLPAVQAAAKGCGYAIGLHGSVQRDLDLIATPWVDEAKTAQELIEAIRLAVNGHIGVSGNGKEFSEKPHGRRAWSIHLAKNDYPGAYLDVSVMPKAEARMPTHRELADFCDQAYRWDDPGCAYGSQVIDIGGEGARCFVILSSPAIVVFRGTKNVNGWVNDCRIRKIQNPTPYSGNIHEGFSLAWTEVRKRVENAIKFRSAIFTGHSLGGAMATLAAYDLRKQVSELVTFGAPRAGDAEFAEAFRSNGPRTTRYVNQLDIVPWSPPYFSTSRLLNRFASLMKGKECPEFGKYRHVCPATYFDGSSWSQWGWQHWLSSLFGWLKGDWTRTRFSFHKIEAYIEAMAKLDPPAASLEAEQLGR